MTAYDGWRPRRLPEARSRAGAPRTPIDYAKVGRSSVRRRARGMTHSETAAGLEAAEQQAHLDRRAAELAEWQRIVQLLAATGGPYDLDADVVVQEELAEDRRREEAEQQRRQEQQRVADRAEELARLGKAGRLDRNVPSRAGDESARELLEENRDYRLRERRRLARSLPRRAVRPLRRPGRPRGRCRPAASLRPRPCALLAALARTGIPVDGDLEFVGRLAQADPAATIEFAA